MFSTWGALIGLAIAIALIVRKATPAYALVLGALVGATSTVASVVVYLLGL